MGATNNPLPVSLQAETRKASKLFAAFADPKKGLDNVIPPHVLRKAKGFAFLTVVKAGFLFSARAGSGCVIARLSDGSWSAPSAVGTAGGGVGFQAGVEMAEFLIILNSRAAVASFMAAGSLTVGGNMSIAAGPLGRNVEGTGSLSSKGKVSAMYSYSRTKGLFGGASLEGSLIVERSDANAKAYRQNVTAKQLLSGAVEVPDFATTLIDTISRRCGSSTEWQQAVDDEEEGFRPDPDQGYSFKSSFASGGSDMSPEKSGQGQKGRFAGLGSIGRSRSSSGAGAAVQRADEYQRDDGFGDSAGRGSMRGPRYDGNAPTRFEHQFESDVGFDDVDNRKWTGGSGASVGKAAQSAKLTKSRSSNGTSGGQRDLMDLRDDSGQGYGQFSAEASPSNARDSFDSLDADSGSGYTRYGYGADNDDYSVNQNRTYSRRDRSSTITSTSSSRPSLLARARSSFKGSSSSRRNSRAGSPAPSPFADDAAATNSSLSLNTVPSNDSYDNNLPRTSTRTRSRSNTNQKPWDSEDEELYRAPPSLGATTRTPSAHSPSNVRSTPRGDPFDFTEVEADFQTATTGRGMRGGSTAMSTGQTSKPPPVSRSRSSTTGGGIGKAIALYDFPGVEATDLPFKKGDVITIVSRDDEEWWKGRLKLVEGNVPRNYLEAHFD